MIANDQDLVAARAQIAELNDRLQAVFKNQKLSHFEAHLAATGYDKLIARLERDVEVYTAGLHHGVADFAHANPSRALP